MAGTETDAEVDPSFDFEEHRKTASEAFQGVQGHYDDCAQAVYAVLSTALDVGGIRVHSIEARAKEIESFGRKAGLPAENDPGRPKYDDPLSEITDLAGVRVITFLLETVDQVSGVIEREFEIIEKSNKSALLEDEQKLGYQSIHYLVKFSDTRCGLPEYERFKDNLTEVQVRTILQHAWAEIEHDIQYKAVDSIPGLIRRRFTSLAGLLEIADREFQAISSEDDRVRSDARELVAQGSLDTVEITPDALRIYADEHFGPDGRMTDFSYEWAVRVLKRLGFETLGQVDECASPYDADEIGRTFWGVRQGQLTRLEDVLLAAMGEEFIRRHPWSEDDDEGWWATRSRRLLGKLEDGGIDVGGYIPQSERAE